MVKLHMVKAIILVDGRLSHMLVTSTCMNVKKLDGYDNSNIDEESDFAAFEEKMRQAKVS